MSKLAAYIPTVLLRICIVVAACSDQALKSHPNDKTQQTLVPLIRQQEKRWQAQSVSTGTVITYCFPFQALSWQVPSMET